MMGRNSHRALALALAVSGGAAVLAVGAPPAAAATSCSIQQLSCTTGHVVAGSDNSVYITAKPGSGRVTCRVYDSYNGIEVGSVTANFWTDFEPRSKTISGLSSMYFATCIQYSGSRGGGSLS
jgi:hypothetical protein